MVSAVCLSIFLWVFEITEPDIYISMPSLFSDRQLNPASEGVFLSLFME